MSYTQSPLMKSCTHLQTGNHIYIYALQRNTYQIVIVIEKRVTFWPKPPLYKNSVGKVNLCVNFRDFHFFHESVLFGKVLQLVYGAFLFVYHHMFYTAYENIADA